jgi:hypothetical protein
MALIDDMVRPPIEWDAMLRHVASWGDRIPHGAEHGASNWICQVNGEATLYLRRQLPTRRHSLAKIKSLSSLTSPVLLKQDLVVRRNWNSEPSATWHDGPQNGRGRDHSGRIRSSGTQRQHKPNRESICRSQPSRKGKAFDGRC